MNQWYERLFANYAETYENEVFTRGTLGECDFIEQEIGFNRQARILDIGCGTGRHSVELAKRGYNVVGIDLSESMLKRARQNASGAGVEVDFHCQDARNLSFDREFDLVIMLCEGGFPLMETDEMNFAILEGASRALKAGGKFIFTTLNGLFPLFHSVKDFLDQAVQEGQAAYRNHNFDLMTFREYNQTSLTDDDGNTIDLACNERYYVPSEITWLLKSLGFGPIDIFGARLGEFSRSHTLTTEDFEMLFIGMKQ